MSVEPGSPEHSGHPDEGPARRPGRADALCVVGSPRADQPFRRHGTLVGRRYRRRGRDGRRLSAGPLRRTGAPGTRWGRRRPNATGEAQDRMNRSTALANPSSSLDVVTRRAAFWTSWLALPMAILSPEWANMSTSLGWSPIVAICSGGIW